jgi:hypothetical protein
MAREEIAQKCREKPFQGTVSGLFQSIPKPAASPYVDIGEK